MAATRSATPSAVDEHVHRDDVVGEHPRLDLACAAAARDEPRHGSVGQRQELGHAVPDALCRSRAVGQPAHLDLRDHPRGIHRRQEPAAGANHLRRVRRRRHDARLLDHHRHDVIVAVDADVERDAVRQGVRPEDVLDELVGGLGVEAPRLEGSLDVARVDAARVAHERTTLGDGDVVEAGESGGSCHGRAFGTRSDGGAGWGGRRGTEGRRR
jgi:hypothetical protein